MTSSTRTFSRRTMFWGVLVLGASLGAVALAQQAPPKTQEVPPAPSLDESPKPSKPAALSLPVVSSDAKQVARAKRAFLNVSWVLKSPRCMNCHPAGDRPLQTDTSRPHAMNISRRSVENGLKCSACHQTKNAQTLQGRPAGPPGALHWGLPPKSTPMVFEGKRPSEICAQVRDPSQNGQKTLAQLVEHVDKDALVLWGWSPGGTRTTPPMAHKDFVASFKVWAAAGAPCPDSSMTITQAPAYKP